MINTLLKTDKKNQHLLSIDSLSNDIYLLPKWEKIKCITFSKKRFLLPVKVVHSSLYRKFSAKHHIEKYSLKDEKDNILSTIDIRVYKDCVYIIDMNISENAFFIEILNTMLQIAVEKTLYNTTEKKLSLNLAFSSSLNNKIKKVILEEDFSTEENQSNYEKNIFGEAFNLCASESSFWEMKINQMHILINK